MQIKNPASGLFFVVVTSDDKVMPPRSIEAGLEINTGEYLKTLTDVISLWIRENHDSKKLMFAQDRTE